MLPVIFFFSAGKIRLCAPWYVVEQMVFVVFHRLVKNIQMQGA